MALKRRYLSYQWQLFIPLVLALWGSIGAMTAWQYHTEKKARFDRIISQLDLVNNRIIAAYNTGINPNDFVDFVMRYYRENPLYDRLRVTVYRDGEMVRTWGEPIPSSEAQNSSENGTTDLTSGLLERNDGSGRKDLFRFLKPETDNLLVLTALPFDSDVVNELQPSRNMLWTMMIIAAIVTIFTYISTRYFGRNIRNLRSVAESAAKDPTFLPPLEYPHDELGEITRQIVYLYNERSAALEKQKREHIVAMHAIEEKARSKRQLTSNINHELRTPIGVIKGYLDTILDNPDMSEEARTRFLSKAREHVDRLVNLIADVSAISRLQEGSDLISTEEVNYHDVVYTAANDLEDGGVLGDMKFSFDIPLDCTVNGNYNLLAGMVTNLCKNSVAYSKGTLCELICTGHDDDFYYFDFHDNGVGVPEEHLSHLFENFYRVETGRMRSKSGGTGLGLPIVQNTVLAHGGTIKVENGETGGLSFKFTLRKFNPSDKRII